MIWDSSNKLSHQAATVGQVRAGFNAPLVLVLSILALTALLYWPTSLQIADLWADTVRRRYTHGWIVLAVTVWLVWHDRAQLAQVRLMPPVGGWMLVAIGSMGWLVGFNAGLLAVTTLAMPLLVLATIWATGGWPLARRSAFAVLFLYFAFPVWELISSPLQSLTAVVSLWLTELAGIPAAMDEYVIHIPEGWFEIAGGCNGLHFLIVALGIATLHGQIDRDSLWSRLLLLGIAAALALITNWLRVFIIIVAGHATNMQHFLVKVDHYYFGWFLFAFALMFYMYLSSRVPRSGRTERMPVPQRSVATRTQRLAAMVLSSAALALGPAWSLAEPGYAADVAPPQPPSIDGWSGPGTYASDWRPLFSGADEEFLVAYRNESDGEVALYRADYRIQRQGKELRGEGNSAVGAGYQLQSSIERHVNAGGRVVSVSEQVAVGPDGSHLLIWSLFAVDGGPDPMRIRGQVAYGIRSLWAAPTATVIALAAACGPDCEHARSALSSMSAKALPNLLPALAEQRIENHVNAN